MDELYTKLYEEKNKSTDSVEIWCGDINEVSWFLCFECSDYDSISTVGFLLIKPNVLAILTS